MSRDLNKTPEEHDQPTGGTANPRHNPVGPRSHEADKSGVGPHPNAPTRESDANEEARPPQRRR